MLAKTSRYEGCQLLEYVLSACTLFSNVLKHLLLAMNSLILANVPCGDAVMLTQLPVYPVGEVWHVEASMG